MSESLRQYILGVILGGLAVWLFMLPARRPGNAQDGPGKERVDTVYHWDTVTVYEPVTVTKTVVSKEYVMMVDTVSVRDTVYVILDREQVTWEDSLSRVYASGIRPQVDSVLHFVKETVVTREVPVVEVKKTRWGIGIQGGYGVSDKGLTPYIGVGVSYNILSW